MTGAFIFGIIFVAVAMSPKFWELIGWQPKDGESTDSYGWRRAIRLVLMLIGSVLVAFNFPGIPDELGYPGWLAFGILALYVGMGKRWTDVYPFSIESFKDDDDTQVVIAWVRTIAMILGCMSVGFGMMPPGEPCEKTPVAVEQSVEAPDPVPAPEEQPPADAG